MAQCVYCGAETQLHVNECPICVRCSDELDAGRQPAQTRASAEPICIETRPELTPNQRPLIEMQLRLSLNAAREEYRKAKRELQRTISEIPSGSQSPDGQTWIHAAGTTERHASRLYREAVKRFYDFVLGDKVPERFNPLAQKKDTR